MPTTTMHSVKSFYKDKTVAVTGHTGFKGSWLTLWLSRLGAKCHGFSLPPPTIPNHFEILPATALASSTIGDIRNQNQIREFLARTRPEIIFHLAAQPLVKQSYRNPIETITTNYLGTAYLIEEIRSLSLKCTLIVVTTDKCYENRGWEFGYRENDPLGGSDIYSASKAACEIVTSSWWKSFFFNDENLGPIATARAGNVIGGGDYAADRIIPDLVRAQLANQSLEIRNPKATRPWQHVLDCLSGYLALGVYVTQNPKQPELVSFNFGPGPGGNLPVSQLVELFRQHWSCPVQYGSSHSKEKEADRLNLSIEKAFEVLKWKPVWSLEEAVEKTAIWYHSRHVVNTSKTIDLSMQQIEDFENAASRSGAVWL